MKDQKNRSAQDLEELFNRAVGLHQNNRLAEACHCYRQILDTMPGSSLVHYNLGLALYEMGKYEQSLHCYAEALKHAPEEKDLLYNYGLCCQKLSRYEEAIETYTQLLSKSPGDIDAIYNLACCYMSRGDSGNAREKFAVVLENDGEHTSALYNLACLLHENGELAQAEKHYSMLLTLQPDHPAAEHLLASIRGETTSKAPAHYVKDIFNNYSSHYDESLTQKLEYKLPQIARQSFDAVYSKKTTFTNTLDLGCGTGLSGTAFTDLTTGLIGVDLSANMIARARQKNIYSELHIEEIETYLEHCTISFECVLAFDTFPYLGSLVSIFKNIHRISEKQSIFCFSIEKSASYPFTLCKSGRYAHSQDYIEETCAASGWMIKAVREVNLRKERGEWLAGTLYFAEPV